MLTGVWYKDAMLIKSRTFKMFGHGFLIVGSLMKPNQRANPDHNCLCPTPCHTCSIYAFCHSSWVTTNTDPELAETISTFKWNDLFLYILMRTSTPPTKADTTWCDRFRIFSIWFILFRLILRYIHGTMFFLVFRTYLFLTVKALDDAVCLAGWAKPESCTK